MWILIGLFIDVVALYKLYRLRKDQRNTEEVKPHPALV